MHDEVRGRASQLLNHPSNHLISPFSIIYPNISYPHFNHHPSHVCFQYNHFSSHHPPFQSYKNKIILGTKMVTKAEARNYYIINIGYIGTLPVWESAFDHSLLLLLFIFYIVYIVSADTRFPVKFLIELFYLYVLSKLIKKNLGSKF